MPRRWGGTLVIGLGLLAMWAAGAPTAAADPTVVAAGDIASCRNSNDTATAKLVASMNPNMVLALGDNVYDSGTSWEHTNCYGPSGWGAQRYRTYATPGNHEYLTPNASGYFGYFGSRAGPYYGRGYYSFDLGSWHLISLDSEIDHGSSSTQVQWLKANLAKYAGVRCTLAFWHRPLFSSGDHGNDADIKPLWDALYQGSADVVLVGHEHVYERFGPQTPGGSWDGTRGIRQFTVGTGGRSLFGFSTIKPNSQIHLSEYGVLQLTLHSTWYEWRFTSVSGLTRDSGAGGCH